MYIDVCVFFSVVFFVYRLMRGTYLSFLKVFMEKIVLEGEQGVI